MIKTILPKVIQELDLLMQEYAVEASDFDWKSWEDVDWADLVCCALDKVGLDEHEREWASETDEFSYVWHGDVSDFAWAGIKGETLASFIAPDIWESGCCLYRVTMPSGTVGFIFLLGDMPPLLSCIVYSDPSEMALYNVLDALCEDITADGYWPSELELYPVEGRTPAIRKALQIVADQKAEH